jgi:hypothetical protein
MTADITSSSLTCHEVAQVLLSQTDSIVFSGFSQSWVETCSSGTPHTISQQDVSGTVSRANLVAFTDTDHGSGIAVATFTGTLSHGNSISGNVTSAQATNAFTGTWKATKQ